MSMHQREALVRDVWDTARSIRAVAASVGAVGGQFTKIAKRLGLAPRARGFNLPRAARDYDREASI
jgi:hypothetical protein